MIDTVFAYIQHAFIYLPNCRLFNQLRANFWKLFLSKGSNPSFIGTGVCIYDPKNTYIGKGTSIGLNNSIVSYENGKISIGDDVLTGQYVTMYGSNHEYSDTQKRIVEQGQNESPITIGNNVWIGDKVTITSGVTIDTGAIIGANSVVTHDVEPYTVIGGCPTKLIRERREK